MFISTKANYITGTCTVMLCIQGTQSVLWNAAHYAVIVTSMRMHRSDVIVTRPFMRPQCANPEERLGEGGSTGSGDSTGALLLKGKFVIMC